MSIHRKAARRDSVETEIVKVLRDAGASVAEISGKGVPDLLVGYRGHTLLAECKSKRGKLTPAQDTFHADWKGSRIYILRSPEDALAMMRYYDEL